MRYLMLVRSNNNNQFGNEPVMAAPSTLVLKKLPHRTISGDMRLVADVRLVNQSCSKYDYRPIQVPQIKDLARKGLILSKLPP